MSDIKYLDGLRYKSFSIVYMHTFGIENCDVEKFDEEFISIDNNAIDDQIFSVEEGENKPVQRFKLPSFNVDITTELKIDGNDESYDEYRSVNFQGKVAVELSLFFNKTAVLTFRLMVVDEQNKDYEELYSDGNFISKNQEYITTDHMISLASLIMGAEHWNVRKKEEKTPSNINLKPPKVNITDIPIDDNLEWKKKSSKDENVVDVKKRKKAGKCINCKKCLRLKKFRECVPLKEKCKKRWEKIRSDEKQEKDKEANTYLTQFDIACQKYEQMILKCQTPIRQKPLNYVYIDVWEDIENSKKTLQAHDDEGHMIDDIRSNCKAELVGLMSMYPQEWPYRETKAFNDVCGDSVAIDVDDFVLVNTAMCVCFGTYGRRGKGSSTDWTEILKQRKIYHVSWAEYMLILEMVLAKKYTISVAKSLLLKSLGERFSTNATRRTIERNADLELDVTELLLALDAVNYSKFISHKIMFERTSKRLEIDRDEANLKDIMDKEHEALDNLLEMRNMRQSGLLNVILAFISMASLTGLLLNEPEMPFLEFLGVDGAIGVKLSIIMQIIACILVVVGIIYLFCYLVGRNVGNKKRRYVRRSKNK